MNKINAYIVFITIIIVSQTFAQDAQLATSGQVLSKLKIGENSLTLLRNEIVTLRQSVKIKYNYIDGLIKRANSQPQNLIAQQIVKDLQILRDDFSMTVNDPVEQIVSEWEMLKCAYITACDDTLNGDLDRALSGAEYVIEGCTQAIERKTSINNASNSIIIRGAQLDIQLTLIGL